MLFAYSLQYRQYFINLILNRDCRFVICIGNLICFRELTLGYFSTGFSTLYRDFKRLLQLLTMGSYKKIIISLFLVGINLSFVISLKTVKFDENYRNSEAFRCKSPQPRSLPVYNLPNINAQGKIYSPDSIVVHRCDVGSGCCLGQPKSHACLPVQGKIEDVSLQLRVIDVFDKQRKSVYEYISVQNHTECACQKVKDVNL